MKITKLEIVNFRGKERYEIPMERFMIFTGKCGAGKSTILKALQFALTGTINKEDVRNGAEKASVTLTFEDGKTISRIRTKDGIKCKTCGKSCTGAALNTFIETQMGVPVDVINSMCSSDFYEAIEQKDLTKFILSILPVQLNFERLIAFLEEQLKEPLNQQQKDHLASYFERNTVFGLQEIENAYKNAFEARKQKKSALKLIQGKTLFDQVLPPETKESLQAQLGEISLQEAKIKDYQKTLAAYDKTVKANAEAKAKKKQLIAELETFASIEKPDEAILRQAQDDKNKFEEAVFKSNQVISTNESNIRMFQRTLENLEKPICPISEKLVCTTDKTGMRKELAELITKNQAAIKQTQDFVDKCREQIAKRDKRMEDYNRSVLAFTQKQSLESQLKNLIIPEVLEKPEVIKVDNLAAMKAEINQKFKILAEFEVVQEAKKQEEELKSEISMLEFAVKAFDVKSGVRSKIMEKTLEPLQDMLNAKSQTINPDFKISMTSESGLDIQISTNGGMNFIPMKNVSSGEFIMAVYLIMSIISNITGAAILLLDNLDKLDAEAFQRLSGLLSKDSQYENIVICSVEHDDIVDMLKKDKNIITTVSL